MEQEAKTATSEEVAKNVISCLWRDGRGLCEPTDASSVCTLQVRDTDTEVLLSVRKACYSCRHRHELVV